MDKVFLSVLTSRVVKIFGLSLISFILAMMLTPIYTFFAYKYGFWKKQREESTTGEQLKIFTHLHANKFKRNIPTMAGVVFIIAIVVVSLLILNRGETWLPLVALVSGGFVGLIDDVINVNGNGHGVAGLRAGIKFTLISIIGLVLGWFFYAKLGWSSIHIPFAGNLQIGWLMIPLFAFAVVSTGNAVNISDGLDGLAGGLAALSFGTFGIIALLQGQFDLAAFCGIVVGALLSYIWFNICPARFFMGDVGSFALGTALGVVAMSTNAFLLLPVIGFLFVIEAGSSLIQIVSKKFFNRKIFLSAPIHQHLQAIGWPETKVTMRFWVIGIVMGAIGVLIALAGGTI